MRQEDILKIAPRILTDNQREDYFERGFVTINGIISLGWI